MFRSIRFVKPGWWMLLARQGVRSAFVDAAKLPVDQRALLDIDDGYDSVEAAKWDAAYVGFYRGLIATEVNALDVAGVASAGDEYRFLRKYFSRWWGVWFLAWRCLQLHNPFLELRGFLRARQLARVDLWADTCPPAVVRPVPEATPAVAVVIPTLNRYRYLKDALADLERQTYQNFEVIVVDQSVPFREEFYQGIELNLRVVRQETPGLWKARNNAVRGTGAEMILLFDDDSRVNADWIARHLDCITRYDADISSGVSLSTVGDRVPESYRNFRQADQLDTGNALVKRSVFEKVGLFDEQFEGQRMGDAEFGLRAFLEGFRIISNPEARRVHLKVESGGLRQMGSWDAFRPKSLLAPRPVPSVLYYLRRYFGNADALRAIGVLVPPSVVPYRLKANRFLRGGAYAGALLLSPLLLLQAGRAWCKATAKLRQGPQIPRLPTG